MHLKKYLYKMLLVGTCFSCLSLTACQVKTGTVSQTESATSLEDLTERQKEIANTLGYDISNLSTEEQIAVRASDDMLSHLEKVYAKEFTFLSYEEDLYRMQEIIYAEDPEAEAAGTDDTIQIKVTRQTEDGEYSYTDTYETAKLTPDYEAALKDKISFDESSMKLYSAVKAVPTKVEENRIFAEFAAETNVFLSNKEYDKEDVKTMATHLASYLQLANKGNKTTVNFYLVSDDDLKSLFRTSEADFISQIESPEGYSCYVKDSDSTSPCRVLEMAGANSGYATEEPNTEDPEPEAMSESSSEDFVEESESTEN